MISVMSSNLESTSDQKDAEVEEERGISSNLVGGNHPFGDLDLHSVYSTEETTRVSPADSEKANETGVSNARNADRVSDLKNEEGTNVVSEMQMNSRRTHLQDGKLKNKRGRWVVDDYDSDFGAVGYGYEVGDMVWGKVKSHPWWPGHIHNENYASTSVLKSKREGHVLVAFFGDSSYGWFLPSELIPFELNFAEKSRQTNLRSFLVAVEEATDELSRRRSLGVACRCRNGFNFWPSGFKGDFLVDIGVGDEPGIYTLSQINKARDSFQPRKILSFMQQLALRPRDDQHCTIEFIKNKATVLACRKSLFEEFDETYAQAFGTTPERPQKPTAPMSLDPSKAPLRGRLVVAETFSKRGISGKTTKIKDQAEKDKYLLKRRDEPPSKKPKKASVGQEGTTGHAISVDGSGFSDTVVYSGIGENMKQNYESGFTDGHHQHTRHSMSMVGDIKPSESSEKIFSSASKKVKVHKQPLANLSSEHAVQVEKKKKKIKKEISSKDSADLVQLPVALGDSGAVAKISGMPSHHVQAVDNSCQLDNQKDSVVGFTSCRVEPQLDSANIELLMLLKDLCALALNPFHGMDRSCTGNALPVFLKFRSLVYQKSLVLDPTESDEAIEARSSKSLSTANTLSGPVDGTNDISMKPVKSSVRPGDSTKSGIKRGPLDRPEGIKKKIKTGASEDLKKQRFNDSEEVKKMKVNNSENMKKKKAVCDLEEKSKTKKINESEDIKKTKKIDDGKLFSVEKKPFPRPAESQRAEVKEITSKNAPPMAKAAKLESSKKTEQSGRVPNPTMLVMKFPSGAGLPSGAELRARFARFGPMDHSATRVFWKSYTCRLVYQYKADAEAALKFVNGSSNSFGSINVRCYLRDMVAEAAEAESTKIQKEDPSTVGNSHSGQLKSCLKKPSSDEGGNGGGTGSRVKFVLDGEESSKNKQLFSEVTSSSSYSLDVNSKNLAKFIVPSPPTVPFHKSLINTTPSTEQASARLYSPQTQPPLNNDISQEMLNLLSKCSDVVSDLTRVLGYVPYRAL